MHGATFRQGAFMHYSAFFALSPFVLGGMFSPWGTLVGDYQLALFLPRRLRCCWTRFFPVEW
jgi:hypothetical protein